MEALLLILTDIIGPVFVLIGLGFIVQTKFKLDLTTLARLNIYLLAPGFIFNALYTTRIEGQVFGFVIGFFLLFVTLMYFVSKAFAKLLKMNKDKEAIFTNSGMFFNSGNYGVPVNDLVFQGDPFAMSIQVMNLTFQNIFLFSYGIFALNKDDGKLKALLGYFRMPVPYALFFGILLNVLQVDLPDMILVPSEYIAGAMVAFALITLGAQVAVIEFKSGLLDVYMSLFLRLILGPLVAYGLIMLLSIEGTMAQALFIGAAMPTSVNSAIIAQEYSRYKDYASQIVLFSTIFSAITVSSVIYLSRLLF
ncbi:hypothetical protein DES38_106122 [Streptohalobacillus salinus]|uniref:Permease n=1 Tax=Streptohalobacillus salinus TaxID=621096 RepID=A0A2V3WFT3_9BACI|nr:AEC family transporter [Streptohalobacillus salinus]PXW91085.1 hypothetical protein DES38_106122 [Streptohalobacillus salinus]